MSFGSSAKSHIDDRMCNDDFVVTCTVAQLYNQAGPDFIRWLERNKGFIVYRSSYDDDEIWEEYKYSISWGAWFARECPGDPFRLTFVEDRKVLDGTSRDDIRKLHIHLLSSIIPSKIIALHQFGQVRYKSPGLGFFVHAGKEAIETRICDMGWDVKFFTLVDAHWKPWVLLPKDFELERGQTPCPGPEKNCGYVSMEPMYLCSQVYDWLLFTSGGPATPLEEFRRRYSSAILFF